MNHKVERLLKGRGGNYIFPFLWLHGEQEAVIRDYMRAVDECGIKAVCVESRPHPDYCGPKWWEDMDVILDEARNRGMKVWILDDSHFPTGFANGAMKDQPDERCRQSICCRTYDCTGVEELHIERGDILHPEEFKPTRIEEYIGEKEPRKFTDDKLLGLFAVPRDGEGLGFREESLRIDLRDMLKNGELRWKVPEGKWKVYVLHLSRNMGYHRSYINMLDRDSCKVLLDSVYEPHYKHYKADFGRTIAGFFSDEPELGNGHMYDKGILFGAAADYPWSGELEEELRNALGMDYSVKLALLWEEDAAPELKAAVRFTYMDAVTRLVEKNFSMQLGEWCRAHKVEYIGHLIEDDNQHARTGSSLGHYFRGLAGQDMAGIDDIGGQVYPQGEDFNKKSALGNVKDGEFYHYALGKLGSSLGAVDPKKKGRTLCEIFGNYGWAEGVQLEKYLVDHFMVRGINHFVPHAFSLKNYPDPDCPPHFYAGGNDPQYRHFGYLMRYVNRVCELLSDGHHIASVAILYHAEAEWTGKYMLMQKPARRLTDRQIDFDFIPSDVFSEKDRYKTGLKEGLTVNTQRYGALIIPAAEFISASLAESAAVLHSQGFPVIFLESLPSGIYDGSNSLLKGIKDCPVVGLEELIAVLEQLNIPEIRLLPANNRIRCYHYYNGSNIFYLVNEAEEVYKGMLSLKMQGTCYAYNAWDNRLEKLNIAGNGNRIDIKLYPRKSLLILFDEVAEERLKEPVEVMGQEAQFNRNWIRSICRSIDYPNFMEQKEVDLPDRLAEEKPEFSGFARYENSFQVLGRERVVLEITDAAEGVEVFVNNKSAGIQITAPYVYDITAFVQEGKNEIAIEAATTLERETAYMNGAEGIKHMGELSGYSGITGLIRLYRQKY